LLPFVARSREFVASSTASFLISTLPRIVSPELLAVIKAIEGLSAEVMGGAVGLPAVPIQLKSLMPASTRSGTSARALRHVEALTFFRN